MKKVGYIHILMVIVRQIDVITALLLSQISIRHRHSLHGCQLAQLFHYQLSLFNGYAVK